jgi:hypothetical protein
MRRGRAFVLVTVIAFGLDATMSVGADELPPPPGWSQEEWNELTPENQALERELSPEPIAPEEIPEIVAAMEEWHAAHGSDEQIADELLAELLAEGPLHPDEGKVIVGITEAQLTFGLWEFEKRWIGVNADETISTQVYAGWLRDDPSVGVVLVREVDLVQGDGAIVPFQQEYVYPGHGGGFRIEGENGGVLTLSRWIDRVQQPGTVQFNIDSRTFTSTTYLHGAGATANPPTLSLDAVAPTASTDKYKDSSSVNFSGGNAWKDVGTWNAAPSTGTQSLIELGDVHAWLGLKNSDDQGTQFDLRAEVYVNGTLRASGTTRCITGLTRNASLAKEATVAFGSFPEFALAAADVLKLKLSTRIGTNPDDSKCSGPGGSHNNAVGLRVYFDSTSRPARFDQTISS